MKNLVWFLTNLFLCNISSGTTTMPSLTADVVLCDIEGTTTSIKFVKNTLFPYATRYSRDFLEENWDSVQVKQIVADLLALPEFGDFKVKFDVPNDSSINIVSMFVNYLIVKDLKLGPLKSLQGLVWNKGYADKTIKGHVYDDVPKAFERWTQKGVKICIYSSGSVKAQKLLFGNSDHGDLMPQLSGYFDTAIGGKREAKSYKNIVEALGVASEKILFLTDIIEEGKAAKEAGLQVIILERPGNAPLSDEDRDAFVTAENFDEIEIKRESGGN